MEPTVDFHTHYIPQSVESFEADGCTRLVIESPTCGQMYEGDKHYRTIDERCWDATRRIGDMDRRNVALQVISPIPVTNSYSSKPDRGLAFARLHNDAIAAFVRARPDRFAGLGAVPLQDVDATCKELQYVRRDLGLLGIEINTTAAGRELDDPALLPFWEQCNALRAIVFIHPEKSPGVGRHSNVPQFIAAAAYPSETGLVAAKLLLGGYLTRFPDVTIVLAHGGGTLAWMLPRLDRFWQTLKGKPGILPEPPSIAARNFYCDTLTFDATNLELVAKRFGTDHLMVGSDYPFGVMEDPPGEVLEGAPFDERVKDDMRAKTYRKLEAFVTSRESVR
jgi:aminocarboxymuconate-semialdehyde decarboxylase